MRLMEAISVLNFFVLLVAETLEISIKVFANQESSENSPLIVAKLNLQEIRNSDSFLVSYIPTGIHSLLVETGDYVSAAATVRLEDNRGVIALCLVRKAVLGAAVMEGRESQNVGESLSLTSVRIEELPTLAVLERRLI